MAMRYSGHLLKRAGREFVRNLIWMAVVFGALGAILAAATDLSLLGVMAFVGVCVALMAAIVTVIVLWAVPTMRRPSAATTSPRRLPTGVICPVAAGMVEEMVVAGGADAAFTPHRIAVQACS
jgi:uncharacterized RDD family membrane protein YckC